MAAGDLIVADWQIELDGVLMGAGTDFHISAPGVGGLGVPQPRVADVELDHGDGAWLGRDYSGTRVVTIPFVIVGSPMVAAQKFTALADLWQTSPVDLQLHLRLPGFGHIFVTGRPRGLTDDLSMLRSGVITALATFYCGDPAITTVP